MQSKLTEYYLAIGRRNDSRYGQSRGKLGPVAWCKRCSRKHRRGQVCKLYLRTRVAKSGRKVYRWCH